MNPFVVVLCVIAALEVVAAIVMFTVYAFRDRDPLAVGMVAFILGVIGCAVGAYLTGGLS